MDQRRVKLKAGLAQLDTAGLGRILDFGSEMVCDTFAYDESTHRY